MLKEKAERHFRILLFAILLILGDVPAEEALSEDEVVQFGRRNLAQKSPCVVGDERAVCG